MREINWTTDGVGSLSEIIDFYGEHYGVNVADNIYKNIMKEIGRLETEETKKKPTQELKDIGKTDVYELVVNPWNVYYKISEDGKKAFILFVLDGRRNIEEILISKVIDS